jgi:hypothetical protein
MGANAIIAFVTARPTVTHALQQLRGYLLNMRVNARVNNKHVEELQEFVASEAKPV